MGARFSVNYTSGATLVAIILDDKGQWWNAETSAFESFDADNIAHYAVASDGEDGTTGIYWFTVPPALPRGNYITTIIPLSNGLLTQDDVSNYIGTGEISWSGTALVKQFQDQPTIYVDGLHGDDSFDGCSPGNAKATIMAGVNAMEHGYKLVVLPGIYATDFKEREHEEDPWLYYGIDLGTKTPLAGGTRLSYIDVEIHSAYIRTTLGDSESSNPAIKVSAGGFNIETRGKVHLEASHGPALHIASNAYVGIIKGDFFTNGNSSDLREGVLCEGGQVNIEGIRAFHNTWGFKLMTGGECTLIDCHAWESTEGGLYCRTAQNTTEGFHIINLGLPCGGAKGIHLASGAVENHIVALCVTDRIGLEKSNTLIQIDKGADSNLILAAAEAGALDTKAVIDNGQGNHIDFAGY